MIGADRVFPVVSNTFIVASPTSSFHDPQIPTTVVAWSTGRTLRKVLRNSLISMTGAWLFAFCCSAGNIFSGRTLDKQSTKEFLVAEILWFHCFFSTSTVALYAFLLLTEQLAKGTTTLSPLLYWLHRLSCSVSPYFIMVAAAVIGGCIVTSSLVKDAQKYKTSVYYSLACFYVFVGCTDAQARHLFRTETVRGQQIGRLQQQQQPSKKAQTTRQTTSWRRLLRVFLHDLPLFVSALFAAAYVHIVSFIPISTKWHLLLFALCSIALKILLQESAKHLLAKRRRANMRMMAIIVAAPTILVDTQLRTVLLCLNNASKTIVGSMLFAAGEVSMRVGKTRYMERMARRMAARRSLPPSLPGRVQTARIHVQPRRAPSLDTIDPIQDRVSRLLSLHAAEIYSEMYAKYIAMGCSYAILFFFGSHPKYDLGLVGSTPESSTSTGTAFRVQWRNVGTAGFQLGIEILVDIVACAFEIRSGIEFEHFNKDDSFLAVFMVAIALVNVHISSSVYLHS